MTEHRNRRQADTKTKGDGGREGGGASRPGPGHSQGRKETDERGFTTTAITKSISILSHCHPPAMCDDPKAVHMRAEDRGINETSRNSLVHIMRSRLSGGYATAGVKKCRIQLGVRIDRELLRSDDARCNPSYCFTNLSVSLLVTRLPQSLKVSRKPSTMGMNLRSSPV